MKKLISILIIIFLIIYVLVEFIGDSIIKSSLESNLSNSLKRETKIDDLSIGYLSGKAEIKNLKISNKDFPGILLEIKNASAKLSTTSIFGDKIEIDEFILDGIDLNYFFNLNKNLKVEDNVKSIQENLNKSDKRLQALRNLLLKN